MRLLQLAAIVTVALLWLGPSALAEPTDPAPSEAPASASPATASASAPAAGPDPPGSPCRPYCLSA